MPTMNLRLALIDLRFLRVFVSFKSFSELSEVQDFFGAKVETGGDKKIKSKKRGDK